MRSRTITPYNCHIQIVNDVNGSTKCKPFGIPRLFFMSKRLAQAHQPDGAIYIYIRTQLALKSEDKEDHHVPSTIRIRGLVIV
jgi:hypothetical protein